MSGHYAITIHNQDAARKIIEDIGADEGGYPYLVPKAVHRCIKLKEISCTAATIIKQEMLSKGGEAAVSRNTLLGHGKTDVLLMGTLKQYKLLIRKLKVQQFGLRKIAEDIETILGNMEPGIRKINLPGGKELVFGNKTWIMGILNITPDSFSDGGNYLKPDSAVAHAMEMMEQGADIIDIGGASSRPDSVMASEKEEIERILPVLTRLVRENIIISIDTFRGEVARQCLDHGAHIINDIGRLQMDASLLPVLVEKQAPVVLMHNRMQFNQGIPYDDLISDLLVELQESVQEATDAGLSRDKIIIDPGIGFGKNAEQNCNLIKNLEAFKGLGFPILMGMSRKRFIGETLNVSVSERLEGNLAVLAISIMNGADIIRVHDVKESKRAAQMVDAVVR